MVRENSKPYKNNNVVVYGLVKSVQVYGIEMLMELQTFIKLQRMQLRKKKDLNIYVEIRKKELILKK